MLHMSTTFKLTERKNYVGVTNYVLITFSHQFSLVILKACSDESHSCIHMKVCFPGDVFLWRHKDVYAATYNQSSNIGMFGILHV